MSGTPITSGRGKFFGKKPGKERWIMKYGELNFGQVEAMVNKLGGMDGVHRFLSGELVVKEPQHKWEVWKTIKLGTGLRTAEHFMKDLTFSGCRIGYYAAEMLKKLEFTESVAVRETNIELVNVSVAELGLKEKATTQEIYKRAQKNNLELCPAEVGPQLRLQYQDQPIGERLLIGMKSSQGTDRIFVVAHYSKPNNHYGVDPFNGKVIDSLGAFLRWDKEAHWIFLRRKST